MARKDIEAGAAYIRLYVQKSELLSGLAGGMKIVAGAAAAAAGAVIAVGGAATGAALAAINHFAASGDEINKMADRTGASVEALSELRYAAAQSGVTLEELELAMTQVAKKGGKGDPSANLEAIADQLAAIPDPGERAAKAMELMGNSGTRLLPLMLGGAKGIQELRQEARDLGQSFDKKAADDATAFGDAWQRVTAAVGGAAFAVGAVLAPAATNILEVVKDVAVSLAGWVRQNAQLLTSFQDITGALAAGNFALVGRLAIESLNLAILEGLAKLSDVFGAGLGDILGTVGLAAIAGDWQKIWDTTVGALAVTWDGFVAGLTDAFTAAADAIVEAWRKATSFISDQILAHQKQLKGFIDLAATVTGAGLFGVTGDSVLGPDVAPGDLAGAQQTARDQIGSTAGRASAALDAARRATRDQANASAEAFGNSVANGRSAAADAAAESRAELGRIMAEIEAANAARQRATTSGLAGDGGAMGPPAAERAIESFGTFSAAAAAAAGGGGVQDRIARSAEKTNELLETANEASLQLLLAFTGLAGALRHP